MSLKMTNRMILIEEYCLEKAVNPLMNCVAVCASKQHQAPNLYDQLSTSKNHYWSCSESGHPDSCEIPLSA
jgi:hypothetical protein